MRGMIALALALAMQPAAAFAAPANVQAAGPDYSKYFYFHKAGVTAELAKADYAECAAYGENVQNIEPGQQTTYVPYYAGPNVSPLAAGLGGAIGAAIGSALVEAFVKAPERRDMRRTILRKCMSFKGYGRFGLDKAVWEKLNDGDDKAVIAGRFGDMAAGATPVTGVLPA